MQPPSLEQRPARTNRTVCALPLTLPAEWLYHVPESTHRLQLRGVLGTLFLVFGLMKAFSATLPVLVGAPELAVASGPEGFARFLDTLGVPFPLLNAWMVIAVEVACGLGLMLGAWLPATSLLTRLSALPLAVDMAIALSVGIRQIQGNPVVMDGVAVMNQAWRLPLEVGLLVGTLYLLWRPAHPARGQGRDLPSA
jgi:uncharacterized membrane protein YphA (DoxX/SURF4 family)